MLCTCSAASERSRLRVERSSSDLVASPPESASHEFPGIPAGSPVSIMKRRRRRIPASATPRAPKSSTPAINTMSLDSMLFELHLRHQCLA